MDLRYPYPIQNATLLHKQNEGMSRAIKIVRDNFQLCDVLQLSNNMYDTITISFLQQSKPKPYPRSHSNTTRAQVSHGS